MSLESLPENRQASFLSQTLRDTEKFALSQGLLGGGEHCSQLVWQHSRVGSPDPPCPRAAGYQNHTGFLYELACLCAVSGLFQMPPPENCFLWGNKVPLICPLVICPTFLFQRAAAKVTSQCSVGWKSCLAIAPSQATISCAANPVTCKTTSPMWTTGQNHPLGSTMTLKSSCPPSQCPL